MSNALDKYFKLSENGTNIRTEIMAGLTTFLTMAYIIAVNPLILSAANLPFEGVLLATVLVCALSSIFMGLYANLPFGLAPGMGINAFFTYTLVLLMGIPWETALGAVFISGLIFFILTVTKVRALIVEAIPKTLRLAVAIGIGLFLSLIGLKNGGFVVGNSATLVGFGGMNATTGLFVFGLILTGWLIVRETKGALIIGIVSVSILGLIVSKAGMHFGWLDSPIVEPPVKLFDRPSFEVFLKLDLKGAMTLGMIFPIFSLLFVDMFDSISTLLGVSQVAGLVDEKGQPKNMQRALLVDSFATAIAGLTGSSSGTTYIESAAGVKEGGRTGLTAVVVGLLFLPFMFLSPLLKFIPPVATAPVLFLIGIFMASPMGKIKWSDYEESIPAFLAIILIPLTYSITQGIIWGFLVYTAIKILRGKWVEIHWMLYVIDVFAILSLFSEQIEGLIFK